jgi:hypothetical protein
MRRHARTPTNSPPSQTPLAALSPASGSAVSTCASATSGPELRINMKRKPRNWADELYSPPAAHGAGQKFPVHQIHQHRKTRTTTNLPCSPTPLTEEGQSHGTGCESSRWREREGKKQTDAPCSTFLSCSPARMCRRPSRPSRRRRRARV